MEKIKNETNIAGLQPISVVIPMHNEAENVKPFISEIQDVLSGQVQFEIVVVDDGSTDDTLKYLQDLKKQIASLRVMRHRGNFGQSASVVSGVRAAQYDWIVTLDGDGQNHPGDIVKLVEVLAQHAKQTQPVLVAGNRRAARTDNWIRKMSSTVANAVRKSLLKDGCPDSGCGIKAFKRSHFLTLPHFDHLHRFLPALFKRHGGQIINVPVQHRPRTRGQSKYGIYNRLWVGIVDLFGVVWLIRRPCRPEIEDHVTSLHDN